MAGTSTITSQQKRELPRSNYINDEEYFTAVTHLFLE